MNADATPRGVLPTEPEDIEARLWETFQADRDPLIREHLCAFYLPFARRIATRHFLARGAVDIEFPDLCQLAYAGLIEAIDRYVSDRGASFQVYASRRITGSILDGVAKMSEVRQQIAHRNRTRYERVQSLSEKPGPSAQATSTTDAFKIFSDLAIGLALGFMLEGTGLYGTEGAQDPRPDAYESLAWKDMLQHIMAEVSALPAREQTVVRRHYVDGMDFEQVGALMSVSKGRVSQIHKTALAQLKSRLRARGEFTLKK